MYIGRDPKSQTPEVAATLELDLKLVVKKFSGSSSKNVVRQRRKDQTQHFRFPSLHRQDMRQTNLPTNHTPSLAMSASSRAQTQL